MKAAPHQSLMYTVGAGKGCHKFLPVVPDSSVQAPAMNKTDVMSCKVCTHRVPYSQSV